MVSGVLIVDAHPIIRDGLHQVLEQDPALRVIGEAKTGVEAIRLAKRLRPALVLMDLILLDVDGISVIASLHRDLPQTEVVVLTAVPNPTALTQAIQAGARGYLFKDAPVSEILAAIQDVLEGRVYLSARVSQMLVNHIQPSSQLETLTEREQEVLQLVGQGCTNKEIMQMLSITQATVKAHVHHIFSKLGVQSRTQAILTGVRLGLLTQPS